jgi:hypothetical protein
MTGVEAMYLRSWQLKREPAGNATIACKILRPWPFCEVSIGHCASVILGIDNARQHRIYPHARSLRSASKESNIATEVAFDAACAAAPAA